MSPFSKTSSSKIPSLKSSKATPAWSSAVVKKLVVKKSATVTSKPITKKPLTSVVSTFSTTKSKPVRYSSIPHLVIVESPAKARTIGKFLWSDYTVRASMWHIVDLETKNMGLDTTTWDMSYVISPEKTKVVAELKQLAKQAQKVWIATDEDREGEAIGRHVANVLWLDVHTTPRIVFHEITKSAIQHAIDHPRTLDLALVDSQQSRRALDRLVGFGISPVLREKIKRGLSAGRVQSVATKMIVEKEKTIKAFIPTEYRNLTAQLHTLDTQLWIGFKKFVKKPSTLLLHVASLEEKEWLQNDDEEEKSEQLTGSKLTKSELDSIIFSLSIQHQLTTSLDEKSDTSILQTSQPIDFTLIDIQTKTSKRSAPAPFITSTLQQIGSRLFGRSVSQVMSAAQKLYENGLITYMRTDSVHLSTQAVTAIQQFIVANYGKNYSQSKQFTSKSKNAQEAHEAIRPTDISTTPTSTTLWSYEQKLYSLIWERTVASQMSDASFDTTTYQLSPVVDTNQIRSTSGKVMLFDGFLKVMHTQDDDSILPKLSLGQILPSQELVAKQQYTKPPARYSEATLVKEMEAKWIGRPSTYAPTIGTIQNRGYVIKNDQKKLQPTDIAFSVDAYLHEHFSTLVNYDFTAKMEDQLDAVATGQINWKTMMTDFNLTFQSDIQQAKWSERVQSLVGKSCPKCGKDLILKFAGGGTFVGCSDYPSCKHTESTAEDAEKLSLLNAKYAGQPCPEGGTLVAKIGRFGPYLCSSEYPSIKWIKSVSAYELSLLNNELWGQKCTWCKKGHLTVKKSKRGLFLWCDQYPACTHTEVLKQS